MSEKPLYKRPIQVLDNKDDPHPLTKTARKVYPFLQVMPEFIAGAYAAFQIVIEDWSGGYEMFVIMRDDCLGGLLASLPDPISRKGISYQEYLKTQHWANVRWIALCRAGFKCQLCGAKETLQTHHNTYENVGNERPEDLVVLCAECHAMFHKHRALVETK